jgi:N-acetylglutamate synthase-like GNAT family acetyltransferase
VLPSSITIRQAHRGDAPRLHELHTVAVRALCADHYAPEILDAWLSSRTPEGYLPPIERGAIFVAERDSSILGFGESAPGAVVAVYVHPSVVRQGVGTMLLRHALARARESHSGPVTVESTLNASAFYARRGFREVKRSTVKRNDVEVPIVVMEHRAV